MRGYNRTVAIIFTDLKLAVPLIPLAQLLPLSTLFSLNTPDKIANIFYLKYMYILYK